MRRSLLLTPGHAARTLDVSVSKLNRMLQDEKMPRLRPPIRLRGKPMFVRSEIEDFVRECIAERSAK